MNNSDKTLTHIFVIDPLTKAAVQALKTIGAIIAIFAVIVAAIAFTMMIANHANAATKSQLKTAVERTMAKGTHSTMILGKPDKPIPSDLWTLRMDQCGSGAGMSVLKIDVGQPSPVLMASVFATQGTSSIVVGDLNSDGTVDHAEGAPDDKTAQSVFDNVVACVAIHG